MQNSTSLGVGGHLCLHKPGAPRSSDRLVLLTRPRVVTDNRLFCLDGNVLYCMYFLLCYKKMNSVHELKIFPPWTWNSRAPIIFFIFA